MQLQRRDINVQLQPCDINVQLQPVADINVQLQPGADINVQLQPGADKSLFLVLKSTNPTHPNADPQLWSGSSPVQPMAQARQISS